MDKSRVFLHDNFLDWCEKEPVPVHEGFGLNLMRIEMGQWERFGMNGAICLLKVEMILIQ